VAVPRARRWLRLDAVYCGGGALIALALAEPLGRFFHVSTLLVLAIGAVTACWALALVWLTRTGDLRQPLRLVAAVNAVASIAVAVLAAVEPARAARLLLIAVAIEVAAFAVAQMRLLASPDAPR
jgi:predicted permease